MQDETIQKIQTLHQMAIIKWGVNSRKSKTVEELVELADALIKDQKNGTMSMWVLEELADVAIMLVAIKKVYGFSEEMIEMEIRRKTEKFEEALTCS